MISSLLEELTNFAQTLADLTLDGECLTHGPQCAGLDDDCDEFVMENDANYVTLNWAIETARRLIGQDFDNQT